jgi:Domain of unknown function (DUF5801)
MAAEIKINDTLVNDQSSGVQSDITSDTANDTAIGTDLSGLSAAFITFLGDANLGTLDVNKLTTTQKDFAGGVEAAVSDAGYVTVTPNGTNVSDLFFSGADGNDLEGVQVKLPNDDPLQTVDGDNIYLWSFGDVVLATTSKDPDAKGDVVAAFYLNETKDHLSASIEMVTFEPIAHPDSKDPDDQIDWTDVLNVSAATSVDFSFAGAPSSDNLFMMVGSPDTAIVVTGKNPPNESEGEKLTDPGKDGIQISQAGSTTSFGVNGNAINPGQGAVITYVTGVSADLLPPPPNLSPTDADIEANIKFTASNPTLGASFTVNQTNPGVGPVSVKITAFADPQGTQESGDQYVDGFADDTKVTILSVTVDDHVVKTGSSQFFPSVKDNGDGTFTISGLSTGDKVSWTTSTDHDRILIENVSDTDSDSKNNNNTFDIGGFSLAKGDIVTESVGDTLFVDDDGPTTDLVLKAGAELRLDESVGTDVNDANAADETDLAAAAGAIGFDTIAGKDLFTETTDFGTDGKAKSDDTVFELTLASKVSGLTDTASGEAVVLTLDKGVISGKTETGGALVLTIEVDKTDGDVTVNQFRAVVHDDSKDPDEAGTSSETIDKDVVGLKITVTDGDKDTATDSVDLGPIINLEDDGPTITVDDSLKGTFKLGAQGTWDHDPGSDGLKSPTLESLTMTLDSYKINDNTPTTVTVDKALTGKLDNGNFVFTGSITDDFNGDGKDDTVDFKLTMDPDNPETYDLQLTTPPGSIKIFDTSQGSLKPGNPDAVRTLDFPAPTGDVVFFAVSPSVPLENGSVGKDPNDIEDLVQPDPDPTETDLEGNNGGLITSTREMHVSTSGIGVNNNVLNGADGKGETNIIPNTSITTNDESFVVNPADDVDKVKVFLDNSVGGYTPNTEDLYYVVYFTDGTVSDPTKVEAGDLKDSLKSDPSVPQAAVGGKNFTIDGVDKDIEAVQLIMGKGTVKIPVIQFIVEQEFNPSAIDLNFTADLFDGDGDHQEDSFSVHLDPV